MNTGEQAVRKVLKALGEVNRRLRDHAVTIRRKPGVQSTDTRLEVIDYQNGPMIEAYVGAEMKDGTALCWSLDVNWTDDAFHMEATLERNSRAGAETLDHLPACKVEDVDELPQALISMTHALLALDSR